MYLLGVDLNVPLRYFYPHKPRKTRKPGVNVPDKKITAYKGFSSDLTCRGFQYEIGQTYTHEGHIEICQTGFHACEHPLDVFGYYEPAGNRFALVELSGEMAGGDGDTKIAAATITIKAEIQIPDMVKAAVDYVFARAKWFKRSHVIRDLGAASATGNWGAASATGYRGAASATGYRGAASATGVRGAASATGVQGAASATGDRGAASATGYQGAASATGDRGAASATGNWGAASATGYRGAASATGVRGAASATGYQGAASATGVQGAASATGVQGAASATGDRGAAMACGRGGRAKASEGSAIFLVERNDSWEIIHVWAGIAGRDGILPDTFYTLDDGRPVIVEGQS